MFRWALPVWLYGLWCLPLVGIFWTWSDQRQRQHLSSFVSSKRLAHELQTQNSPGKRWWGRALVLLGIACLWVGVARPQLALARKAVKVEGLDILFVVDTSRSMDAQDLHPSRLGRAQRALFLLSDQLAGNRLGIMTFAGVAFMSCPLTQDLAAFKLMVDALNTSDLPVRGTDLGSALAQAADAFERTGARHRVLVVVSDGENFGKTPVPVAARIVQQGVKTYTLAVGSEAGAPVPGKTTANGKPPVTKTNLKFLRLLAAAGNGNCFVLSDAGQEEEKLVAEMKKLEKLMLVSEQYQTWQDLYPWTTGLALIGLLLQGLLGQRRGLPWPTRWTKVALLFAGLASAGLMHAGAAQAEPQALVMARGYRASQKQDWAQAAKFFEQAVRQRPGDPVAEYDWGCSLLMQYRYIEAYQLFKRALRSAQGTVKLRSWYNLGYTSFYLGLKQGEADYWVEATEGFTQVLLQNPQDDDARYNLELVLREIKRRTQTSSRQEQQSQGSDQGQNEGSGANKPGPDRAPAQGKPSDSAPPSEAQQNTTQRKNDGNQSAATEKQSGRTRKGMSQDNALRTLRSLETEDAVMEKNLPPSMAPEKEYHGPDW